MRSIVIALLLFVSADISAQTSLPQTGFGRGLGASLDSAACRYFGLFTRVSAVSGARLEEQAGGARLVMSRSPAAGDTVLMLTASQVHQLRAYIDRFEALFPHPEKAPRLDSIMQMIQPERPFTGEWTTYRITDRAGRRYDGVMLYANDSTVLLAREMEEYEWARVERSVMVFRAEQIEMVERSGRIPAALGVSVLAATAAGPGYQYVTDHASAETMVAGIAWGIGAGIGVYDQSAIEHPVGGNRIMYDRVLPSMRDDAAFDDRIPPEIDRLLRRGDDAVLAALPPAASIDELVGRDPLPRFSVHYASGIPLYTAGNAIPVVDRLWKTSGTGAVNDVLFLRRIGLGYGITDRIGVSLEHISAEMSSYSFVFDGFFQLMAYKVPTAARENYRFQTFRATGSYALLAPNFVRGQRLSLSIGAGVGYSPVTVDGAVYTESNDGTRSLRATRTAHHSGSSISGNLLAEIGYRPIRAVSIFASFDATFASSVTVPGWSFDEKLEPEDPFTPTVSAESPEHQLDISAGGMLLGLRFHF